MNEVEVYAGNLRTEVDFMLVEVLPSAGTPVLPYLADKLVIVIDVLRATSTMVTALANGCQTIVPVLSEEEAEAARLTIPGVLLGGERQGLKIEGFDLGNSPYEYAPERVGGKKIIMTTTNGTRAIRAAAEAPFVWMASFLNLQSVLDGITRLFAQKSYLNGVVIICAGTDDRFDLADTLCAGMLIHCLGPDIRSNDLGSAAKILYTSTREDLLAVVFDSDHGRRLTALGFEQDVHYCLTPNVLPIIPSLSDGEIVWNIED